MDGFRHISEGARTRFAAPGFARKLVLGAAAAAAVVSVAVFVLRLQNDRMAVLYSGLSPEDASAALVELSRQDVRSELRDGGTTILVPAGMKDRLRLDLSGRGIPSRGNAGLGTPEDRRALEDELAKSIESLQGIQSARVHLVLPRPGPAGRNAAGATASVVLRLDDDLPVAGDRIAGIQAMVAAGVANLAPDGVTVVDQHGTVLNRAGVGDAGGGGNQLAVRKEVEGYLAQKATAMLDRVLGPGRSIVRVDATLNLEKIDRERETYDPAQTVVRSEVRTESSDAQAGTSEHSETSYEINRTVERIVGQPGGISGLAVAVFVDGHYAPAVDGGAPAYRPLGEDELEQLKRIVQTAVGLNTGRGDRIEMVNMPFRPREAAPGPGTGLDWLGLATRYGGRVLLLVVLAAVMLALRRNVGRILDESFGGDEEASAAGPGRAGEPAAAQDEPEPAHFDGIPEATYPVVEEIQVYAAENPDRVAEVIEAWIQDIDRAGDTPTAVGG